MSLDISCINIIADINTSCVAPKIGDYRQVGVMFPQEDIDQSSIVNDGCSTKFNLKVPSAIRIFDRSFTPFKGSEVTEENKERFKVYNDTVIIPIIDMTPDNAYVYSKLANGSGRWTVILGVQEGTDADKNHYQVFGMSTGLVVKSKVQDKANQAYLAITMTEENSGLPARFYFDTSKATTEAKLEAYLGYQQITGVRIGSGNVTPQKVYLNTGTGTTCYAVLPDGTVLTSTGGVIDYDYAGFGGELRLIVSNSATQVHTNNSGDPIADFTGDLNCNLATGFILGSKQSRIILPKAPYVYVGNSPLTTEFYAPLATDLLMPSCALTPKTISEYLRQVAKYNPLAAGTINFGGETNPSADVITTYMFGDSDTNILFDWVDANLPNYEVTFRTV